MRINIQNMLRQAGHAIPSHRDTGAYSYVLQQLAGHLLQLRDRTQTGDMTALDEFFKLYVFDDGKDYGRSAQETRSEVQAVCDRAAHLADVPTPLETAPDDGKLWAMHVPGPDDVWACESKAAAEQRAREHNDAIRKVGLAEQFGMQPAAIEARVIEWPHTAESHAESLRDGVADSL